MVFGKNRKYPSSRFFSYGLKFLFAINFFGPLEYIFMADRLSMDDIQHDIIVRVPDAEAEPSRRNCQSLTTQESRQVSSFHH